MGILDVLSELNITVDIPAIVACLAVGFIIKHFPAFQKISNNIIPVIIVILCLVIGLGKIESITPENVINTFISYIISAAISIGFHQQGKSFLLYLKNFIDTIGELKNNKKE